MSALPVLPRELDRFEVYRSAGVAVLRCTDCGERVVQWHRLALDTIVLRAVDHWLNTCPNRVTETVLPAPAGSTR